MKFTIGSFDGSFFKEIEIPKEEFEKDEPVTTNPLLEHSLPKYAELIYVSEGKVKKEIIELDFLEKDKEGTEE